MNEVAYSPEIESNPNFVSRPPDPGPWKFYGMIGREALYHSPFKAVSRFSELLLEEMDPFHDTRTLTSKEATSLYGLGGQLKFDEPIEEGAARLMMSRKMDENEREYVIQSGQTNGFRTAAGFGVGMASTLLDPINFASMFLPIVGEARFARMVQRFGGSVMKARAAAGAIEGTVGMAMVEPLILLPAMQEQANYDLQDSALNLGFGATLGSALHVGFGAIGDRIKKLSPREQDAIFEAAMNNIMSGEPVTAPTKVYQLGDESIRDEAIRQVMSTPDDFIGFMERNTELEPTTPVDATLNSLIGKDVEYSGYVGKLIRDEEGNFLVLREVTLDGSPNRIEVSGTGKDPSMQAVDVGVLPKGTESRMRQIKTERLEVLKQQIDSDQIRKAEQDKNFDIGTKEFSSRLTSDELSSTTETPKVLNDITKEADDLEKSLGLEEAQKKLVDEQIKSEIGNPQFREAGVTEGINCIIRNLV